MATHSSVLDWRIPGTGEPGGLPSMGLQSWIRLRQLSSSSSENWVTTWISLRLSEDPGETGSYEELMGQLMVVVLEDQPWYPILAMRRRSSLGPGCLVNFALLMFFVEPYLGQPAYGFQTQWESRSNT